MLSSFLADEMFYGLKFNFRPIFRSYKPQDEKLKESQLPKAKPIDGK